MQIERFNFKDNELIKNEINTIGDINVPDSSMLWIDLKIENEGMLKELEEKFQWHPVIMDGINNHRQLPKFEMVEDWAFLTFTNIGKDRLSLGLVESRLTLLLKGNLLVSIRSSSDIRCIDKIKAKVDLNYKRWHKLGPDHLFLLIVDAAVDQYLEIMEDFRTPIEDLEVTMVKRPGLNIMGKILDLKGELGHLRKFILPLKEELQRIRTEQYALVKKPNVVFLNDIVDHLSLIQSNFETYREMLRDLTDLHHSNQSLVMNNIMKTLTVISAIFIPLTFIVGIYGMNFDMPEFKTKYGYWVVWLVMITVATTLIMYMRRKKWF